MKTIGIDARLYSQTGVGTYLRNFLHFLSKKQYKDIRFLIYLLDGETTLIENTAFEKHYVPYRWHSFSEQTGFYNQLEKDKPDLMHFTYFSYPVRYTRPFVATVHDLTPVQFKTGKASTRNPLFYGIKHEVFKFVLRNQIKNARKIITPTETVKKQIVEYLPDVDKNKITAIYEGFDYELAQTKENTELSALYPKPFFLYVGNFYPHKNVSTLIQAFKEIPEKYDLVLSGPQDFFASKMLSIIKDNGLEKRVHMHHSPGKENLKYLYNHAEALIHPSFSEGFGLPLVEAMAVNLPIIASDIPVFKELLPADTPMFDPQSGTDIARTVQNYLKSPKKPVYSDVIDRYSFETMAEKTLELYNSLL
jgi:glycosyltransferase involved in cell wall biosynthesis